MARTERIKITKGFLADFITIDNVTIAVPHDCPIGASYRHEDDCQYDEVGQAISMERMLKNAKRKGII